MGTVPTTPTDPLLLQQQLKAQEQHMQQLIHRHKQQGRPSKAKQQPYKGSTGSSSHLRISSDESDKDWSDNGDSDY